MHVLLASLRAHLSFRFHHHWVFFFGGGGEGVVGGGFLLVFGFGLFFFLFFFFVFVLFCFFGCWLNWVMACCDYGTPCKSAGIWYWYDQ